MGEISGSWLLVGRRMWWLLHDSATVAWNYFIYDILDKDELDSLESHSAFVISSSLISTFSSIFPNFIPLILFLDLRITKTLHGNGILLIEGCFQGQMCDNWQSRLTDYGLESTSFHFSGDQCIHYQWVIWFGIPSLSRSQCRFLFLFVGEWHRTLESRTHVEDTEHLISVSMTKLLLCAMPRTIPDCQHPWSSLWERSRWAYLSGVN